MKVCSLVLSALVCVVGVSCSNHYGNVGVNTGYSGYSLVPWYGPVGGLRPGGGGLLAGGAGLLVAFLFLFLFLSPNNVLSNGFSNFASAITGNRGGGSGNNGSCIGCGGGNVPPIGGGK